MPNSKEAHGGGHRLEVTRLGDVLRARGTVTPDALAEALAEQARAGGRLGEILVAHGAVAPKPLRDALAEHLGVATVGREDQPAPLLSSSTARRLRAVALSNGHGRAAPVALADPAAPVVHELREALGRPVEPKLADFREIDELTRRTYGKGEVEELTAALRERRPKWSAATPLFGTHARLVAGAVGALVMAGLAVDLSLTLIMLVAAATAIYTVTTALRLFIGWRGWQGGATFDATITEIAALDEQELPVYSVLLPLYREKESTLRVLFAALSAIEYPRQKLDCLLLLEEDDHETQAAVERLGCPEWFRLIVIPPGGPKTKPMAMLYALRAARGEFVTVYDAEDKPDPLQLKRAIHAFANGDPKLACLQAKLGYYNPRQNLLTRLFTLEYDAWFNLFLPGLAILGAPLPLGGTSNHFRRRVLEECLAWDPYNVTEDADLGIRLARVGWQVGLLESTTYEEANSKLGNWIRQRSRWVKGYLQTLLVHFREPRTLAREIGWSRVLILALSMGGSVVVQLLTPVFWVLLVVWFALEPAWLQALFPAPVFYPALATFLVGNFALIFFGLLAAVGRRHDDLAPTSLLLPAYWLLMSIASYLAVVELVRRPYHWHKTEHGLHFAAEQSEAP